MSPIRWPAALVLGYSSRDGLPGGTATLLRGRVRRPGPCPATQLRGRATLRLMRNTVLAVAVTLTIAPAALGQKSGIGYVYPAGGQQGTTIQVTLGGDNLEGVSAAYISGAGVQAKVLDNTKMGFRDQEYLREEMQELSKQKQKDERTKTLIAAMQARIDRNVTNPSSKSIANQVLLEVTLAPDAAPGEREIRLCTPRGLTNPLVFYVGQTAEVSEPPMLPSRAHVLGREEASLAKRVLHEEARVTLPLTANGQIPFGGIDRYRFEARKGQRLVASVQARQLVPYIADAVPGWFQAVLVLYDAKGKEVAYDDDYRFKPDPVIFYEMPQDGEYVLAIHDAIFRGREDFVYRLTVGELPFVTSLFPLGGPAGAKTAVDLKGRNLTMTRVTFDATDKEPGIYPISVRKDKWNSNRVPFAVDTLPECLEQEPNNAPAAAQKVKLPIIVNGRIDRPGDCDVFRFEGKAGDAFVAEVTARRLDSPLDSVLKLTDAAGKLLALNDDQEDKIAGLNTHDADSYLTATLPADGTYYVHLGDTQHSGGPEYAYRLRLSAPRPDFALRVVPSSVTVASKGTGTITVHAFRKDGFAGDIKLELKDPPAGFSMAPVTLPAGKDVVQAKVKTDLAETTQPVALVVRGRATVDGQEVVRDAVPAEDMMQAFAYRHLVPAQELTAVVPARVATPPPPKILTPRPVKIPVGGKATVRLDTSSGSIPEKVRLRLPRSAAGITLSDVSSSPGKLEFTLQADAAKVQPGLKATLAPYVFTEDEQGCEKEIAPGVKYRMPLCTLPTISFEIVEADGTPAAPPKADPPKAPEKK